MRSNQLNTSVRVACLQMNSGEDVDANVRFIEQQIVNAEPFDLLVLPENFAQMPKHRSEQYTEPMYPMVGAKVQQFLLELARRFNIHIVAGTLPIVDNSESDSENTKPFSRCLIVAPEGIVSHYDKLHLFDVDVESDAGQQSYRESATYRHGDLNESQTEVHNVTLNEQEVRLATSVCYDMRFPELYRRFSRQGAHIVTVPSAFTFETGQAHWETLLRARAIENQTFVVAPGQVGHHPNGRQTWGHSMIIDPWGKILACKEFAIGLLYADLDLHLIDDIKSRFPSSEHRRLID